MESLNPLTHEKTILILLFIVLITPCFYGQANISVAAPAIDNNFGALPNGSANSNYGKGCFLINQSELQALLSSNITGMGFLLWVAPSSPASANFTLYLENTNNFLYSKSTTFTTAITGMTNVYSGPISIPATNNSTVTLPFPSNFNYTGGGLYVAYEWTPNAPPISNPGSVYYAGNAASSNMGAYTGNGTNNPNQLTYLNPSPYRPVCVFDAINTATNESEVIIVNAPGKIAEGLHASYTILADVQNKSINALTNLNVTLDITGSNIFNDVQVIPTIAPGAIETVSFTAFSPIALGNNLISVRVPNDQYNNNNQKTLDQEVTCGVAANNPPVVMYSIGYGGTNPITCLSRFNFNTAATLTAVNLQIAYDYSSNGQINGVVLDDQGTILATTNTISPAQNVFNSFQTFTFTNPQALNANSDYYIGMAETKGYYMGANQVPAPPNIYYFAPIGGGNIFPFPEEAYFGIEPVLSGQGIEIIQASTVICLGESIQLSASAGATFTWSSSVFNPIDGDVNSAGIIVYPTSNEIYTLESFDDAGCENTATAPVAVKPCTGLSESQVIENVELYPNPSANGKAFVKGLEGVNTLTVFNVLGEVVYTRQSTENNMELDLSSQPPGTYLVKIEQPDKAFKIIKLLNQL